MAIGPVTRTDPKDPDRPRSGPDGSLRADPEAPGPWTDQTRPLSTHLSPPYLTLLTLGHQPEGPVLGPARQARPTPRPACTHRPQPHSPRHGQGRPYHGSRLATRIAARPRPSHGPDSEHASGRCSTHYSCQSSNSEGLRASQDFITSSGIVRGGPRLEIRSQALGRPPGRGPQLVQPVKRRGSRIQFPSEADEATK